MPVHAPAHFASAVEEQRPSVDADIDATASSFVVEALAIVEDVDEVDPHILAGTVVVAAAWREGASFGQDILHAHNCVLA